ncbi:hypothetical protein VNI00_002884 [Paramarasmius palmivorus]|uniref:Fungal lipase-type domain-containing protein n=1 Tax=Paramarasmius palmivorus TaxID=297713 RepID=A0AAW0DXB3_9AGAR
MSISLPIIQDIHDAHARQLAHLHLPPGGIREPPDSDTGALTLEDILEWIKDHPQAVREAKDAQCTSPSPDSPNWNSIFFALIESSAVGLRNENEIVEAIKAARDGHFDTAVKHLKKAQSDIDKVGTTNWKEAITDLDWKPIAPQPAEIAWGASMHSGFFKGLFGRFASEAHQVAFDVILNQLKTAYDEHGGEPILHFTGHSLGGAYCTLTYGEFLRRQAESKFAKYRFGDMYSFGAPRVCTPPFFQHVNDLTQAGGGKYLFRVVNSEDPVPTAPPPPPPFVEDTTLYPFVHVGGAWKLLEIGPQKMADEPPPVDPQSLDDLLKNAHYHGPKEYYANWQKTPHA